jgi:hypothetical protein
VITSRENVISQFKEDNRQLEKYIGEWVRWHGIFMKQARSSSSKKKK